LIFIKNQSSPLLSPTPIQTGKLKSSNCNMKVEK